MTAHPVIFFSEIFPLKETMLQKESKADSFTGICSWDDFNSFTLDYVCAYPSHLRLQLKLLLCVLKSL